MKQNRKHQTVTGFYMDPTLAIVAGCLIVIGLIMVASSSMSVAEARMGDSFYYFKRQLFFLGASLVAMFVLVKISADTWFRISSWCLPIAITLLVLVFVPGMGREVNGSLRWLELGIAGFQVAEAVKLILIIYMAGYLLKCKKQLMSSFSGVLKPLLYAAIVAGLLLAQPDYGSAVLVLAIVGVMIWLAGAAWRHMGALLMLVVPVVASAALLRPYRLHRLTSFTQPWQDPFGDGYQLTQALIAVGRGSWFGVGLGASVQKLFYLPEAHTDFIFAVLSEEFGLFGAFIVLLLYLVLTGRLFFIGIRAIEMNRLFSAYFVWGLALWLALQALISVGVNYGVLPTKGLTLPFISSGGSSLLIVCCALAIAFRISHELHFQLASIQTAYSKESRSKPQGKSGRRG